MRIALAQLASTPDREINLGKVESAMREARQAGADLVAFPEVVLDRFFPACPGDRAALSLAEPIPGPITDRVATLARELSLVTVFNLYEVDGEGRRFDSSPVFDADGQLLGVTRMLHITDFPGCHEKDYYTPGNYGVPTFRTKVGKIGVTICYDRHYPEVMRFLGIQGAELVIIPQAGPLGEWPDGMLEAEVRTAAFQNGYFAALCNRAGTEGSVVFAGESFVVDPEGRIIARAAPAEEELLICDINVSLCEAATARRLFWRDRRPNLYTAWFTTRQQGLLRVP